MQDQQPENLKRRGFLLAAGAGGAGAVAAIAVGVGKDASPLAAPAAPLAAGEKTGGYEETAHVSNYYRTARV